MVKQSLLTDAEAFKKADSGTVTLSDGSNTTASTSVSDGSKFVFALPILATPSNASSDTAISADTDTTTQTQISAQAFWDTSASAYAVEVRNDAGTQLDITWGLFSFTATGGTATGGGVVDIATIPSDSWLEGNADGNVATGVQNMNRRREGPFVASDGDTLIVAGGYDSETGSYLDSVETYTDSGGWQLQTAMPAAKGYGGTAVANGTFYAVAGFDSSGYLDSVYAYDIANDSWSTKTAMPAKRSNSLGFAAADGSTVYHVGGFDTTDSAVGDLYAYDVSADSWSTKTSMPTPRYNIGTSTVPINGEAYVICGTESGGTDSTANESYDISADSWSTNSDSSQLIENAANAVIDTKVYQYDTWDQLHVYDTNTDSYSPLTFSQDFVTGDARGAAINGLFHVVGGTYKASQLVGPTNFVNAYKP